jgi:hypothetical protein
MPTKGKLYAAKGFSLQPAPFSVAKLLIDIGFVRILLACLSPFRAIIAWQLLAGKSIWHVALIIERSILRAAGWLHAPPKSRAIRHVFNVLIDVRRWHLVAGKHTMNLTSPKKKYKPALLLNLNLLEVVRTP